MQDEVLGKSVKGCPLLEAHLLPALLTQHIIDLLLPQIFLQHVLEGQWPFR
jgi:hypothetical protein